MVSYQPTVWMIVILVTAFPNTDGLSSTADGSLAAFIALLILYGTAVAGFTYCVSFSLSTPTVAAIFVFMGGFLFGLILSIVGMFLRIINGLHPGEFPYYKKIVRYIFCVFPFFALGDGLNALSLRNVFSLLELQGGKQYKPLDWDIAGMPIAFLAWETFFFLAAAILYEYLSGIPSVRALFCRKMPPPVDENLKDEGLQTTVKIRNPTPKSKTLILLPSVFDFDYY
jgi:ATP-binding cassette subfamily A (ABC1) protein 1